MKKIVLILAGVAVLLAACSKPTPPAEPVRAVKVIRVGANDLSWRHEYSGEVRAQVESRLGFRVGGKLIKRQAELGQHVKSGQVLAQLDPQDYRLAADAARAQVAVAATNRDLAVADFKRYKLLKDQSFISGAELERRETTLKAAQAQLDQAQAQLAVQGNQATYTSLLADVSGVVTSIEAEPGQVVAAGSPVVRIAADGARDAVFSVPEDRIADIKVGVPVRIRVWAKDTELPGKVREVAASSDPVTRTYLVKVAIGTEAPPPLGATVYVVPEIGVAAAVPLIKLPSSALVQQGKNTAVWVLDKSLMTVKLQAIQIATADGNEVVVAAGLQPGMLVVSAGVHVLSPGQKVTIYQAKEVPAPAVSSRAASDSLAKSVPALPAIAAASAAK